MGGAGYIRRLCYGRYDLEEGGVVPVSRTVIFSEPRAMDAEFRSKTFSLFRGIHRRL